MTDLCDDGSEIDPTVSEEMRENGLEHVSKSRIKTFLQCPRKFYLLYWCENRTPGSYHTTKGSRIHRAYEDFHLNLIEYAEEHGERPDLFAPLMENWRDYHQWLDPHVENFWMFEEKRWDLAMDAAREDKLDGDDRKTATIALDYWLPIGVEVEGRLEKPPAGDIPWMGYADAVLNAACFPEVEEDEGVVILDYKTGKTEDEKYRDKGIYLEGEFYGWLFEEDESFDHKVVAVAGYYPQNDDLVVSPYPDFDRRNTILDAVEGMQEAPDIENYEYEEQPLCHYKKGRCFFYNECPSTWGLNGGAGYHNGAEKDLSVTPGQKPEA
jgi:hypothetical protein